MQKEMFLWAVLVYRDRQTNIFFLVFPIQYLPQPGGRSLVASSALFSDKNFIFQIQISLD